MIWYVNVVVLGICLSLVSHTLAQSDRSYEISWSTIDGGGGIAADLDGSGEVDFADLKDFADLWLKCCPIGWPLK